MDVMLTLGGRRFGFSYLLLQHHNASMGLQTLPSCYMGLVFYSTSLSLVNQ